MVRHPRLRAPLVMILAALGLATFGCSEMDPVAGGDFSDHDEPSDLNVTEGDEKSDGLSATFNRNLLMSDDFFAATYAIDGDGLQDFLETSPYGTRSWLADATVHGVRASDAIVAASAEEGINPLVMLGRMQVEKSLVSKTVRPSQHSIDFAFGCGCHDGQACFESMRGLDKQIACSAEALSTHFQNSRAGVGAWRKGKTKASLDPLNVTPASHATASLYAYTPWVLRGRGGNWLVWNITRKFEQHAKNLGDLQTTPELAIAPYWSRDSDGTYALTADAPSSVQRVEYYTDGIVIAEASRMYDSNFTARYAFTSQGQDRSFEVRGYNAQGAWIAAGNGKLDVTSREGVSIRQVDRGEYEITLERADYDVYSIRASADGLPLEDLDSGSLVMRANFESLGEKTIEIRLFDILGLDLRGYERTIEIR